MPTAAQRRDEMAESGSAAMVVDEKRVAELNDMVGKVISSFVTRLRDALINLPITDEDGLVSDWMPRCERQIRACLQTLSALGLPKALLKLLETLLTDFQRHIVISLFDKAKKGWAAQVLYVKGGFHFFTSSFFFFFPFFFLVASFFELYVTEVEMLAVKEDWKPVGHGMHTRLVSVWPTHPTSQQ